MVSCCWKCKLHFAMFRFPQLVLPVFTFLIMLIWVDFVHLGSFHLMAFFYSLSSMQRVVEWPRRFFRLLNANNDDDVFFVGLIPVLLGNIGASSFIPLNQTFSDTNKTESTKLRRIAFNLAVDHSKTTFLFGAFLKPGLMLCIHRAHTNGAKNKGRHDVKQVEVMWYNESNDIHTLTPTSPPPPRSERNEKDVEAFLPFSQW